jgi:hypothetical protein
VLIEEEEETENKHQCRVSLKRVNRGYNQKETAL